MARRRVHPEAKRLEILARVDARPRIGAASYRYGWEWLLTLREPSGIKHFYRLGARLTHAEASLIRDAEMAGGRYEVAWLHQRPSLKKE
jgi:hypothetical protein